MRIDWVKIDGFRNLNNFHINLDESKMHTVLLGQNATGKSNFIEALILVFKYLDFELAANKRPDFNFEIKYECLGKNVRIKFWDKEESPNLFVETDDIEKTEKVLELYANEKILTQKEFRENKSNYLPQYVFTYYSGLSNRLDERFWDSQKRFYDKIIKAGTTKDDIDDLRRLFYVKQIHSYFVLLAFFTSHDKEDEKFLSDYLGIEGLDSVLFVLKKARWTGTGDKRFWGAHGLVQEFLDKLWSLSIGPLYNDESVNITFRNSTTQNRLYLYISNKEKLNELADFYRPVNEPNQANTNFFKALESTYISEVLEEVRVRVRIKSKDDLKVTFRDLSEGEQQLLTVLGLLKFTKERESLILLDEPDTHLNPLWKWEYLQMLNKVVKRDKTTQLIINTHDPLVIGSLLSEEVRIFDKSTGSITTGAPEVDPRGMGVQGILTSELFGLPTTVDTKTFEKIQERNGLIYKMDEEGLMEEERNRLRNLFKELNSLGFAKVDKDPDYQKFLIEQERLKTQSNESHDTH